MQPIFEISSFKPFSVAVPGGGGGGAVQPCLLSDPVATQNTGFLVTSSSKLRKKNTLLVCVSLYVKIFSLSHKQNGVKTEKMPRETTA